MKRIFHPWVPVDLFLFTKRDIENLRFLFDSFHVTKLFLVIYYV